MSMVIKRYRFVDTNGYPAQRIEDSVKGSLYVSEADFDAQRLRADTAEATVAERDEALVLKQRDLIEAQTAVTGWARKHAAAEQRIANTVAKLELAADMLDDDERGNRFAEVLRLAIAALNPNPEAESHES